MLFFIIIKGNSLPLTFRGLIHVEFNMSERMPQGCPFKIKHSLSENKKGRELQSVFPVSGSTLLSQVVLKLNYASQPVPTQTLSLTMTLGLNQALAFSPSPSGKYNFVAA
jgi:hypothetical protein